MVNSIGQICRVLLSLFILSGLVTTWREADDIRLLQKMEQESAFSAICADQVALRDLEISGGVYLIQVIVGGKNPIKLVIGDKIGAGLKGGASTATIMREMFLGKTRVKYALCSLLFLCLPLVLTVLDRSFVRSWTQMQK